MDLKFVGGAPADERVAAVIASAIQSYLAFSAESAGDSTKVVSRWSLLGRREALGTVSGLRRSKRTWGRDVS